MKQLPIRVSTLLFSILMNPWKTFACFSTTCMEEFTITRFVEMNSSLDLGKNKAEEDLRSFDKFCKSKGGIFDVNPENNEPVCVLNHYKEFIDTRPSMADRGFNYKCKLREHRQFPPFIERSVCDIVDLNKNWNKPIEPKIFDNIRCDISLQDKPKVVASLILHAPFYSAFEGHHSAAAEMNYSLYFRDDASECNLLSSIKLPGIFYYQEASKHIEFYSTHLGKLKIDLQNAKGSFKSHLDARTYDLTCTIN